MDDGPPTSEQSHVAADDRGVVDASDVSASESDEIAGSDVEDTSTSEREASQDASSGGFDDADSQTDDGPSLAGIFGGDPSDAPKRTAITPGDPSLENAIFVALGVLFSTFVLVRTWQIFTA